MRRLTFGLLAALLLAFPASALALAVPQASGYVVDDAHLLSADTVLKLEHFLRDFDKSDSTQIVVLTIPSLKGEALEDYSLKVAETWGIGQKGKDNGALLLIAQKEHKVRIEVGYGLEGRLTDLIAGRIVDNIIVPRFREGDFDDGVVDGVVAMTKVVRGEYKGNGETDRHRRNPLGWLALLLFFGPGLMFFGGGGRARRGSRRGGFWIGGPPFGGGGFGGFGGGGGGFSGGGGGFGGGGASGGW
ncbi:MAG TPA: TPM domain-containing protein [Desulfuromonadales bacterium]|nr:TPM domain-containing protein [Desulfuromonadales bacterium]